MRASSSLTSPFEEGKKSGKLRDAAKNPYPDGSVEANNYEVGRQFGLRHFREGVYIANFEQRA